MSESAEVMTTAFVVAWGLGLATQIAYLVVALTIVRKRSSRASLLLSLASATSIVMICVSPAATALIGRFGDGGAEAFARTQALITLVGAIIGAAAHVLGIVGLITLARPPKHDPRDPDLA